MLLVESILGNAADATWKPRLGRSIVDSLRLDQWRAQKNRFRCHTEAGVELAVSLSRNVQLRDGDVLHWDEAAGSAIVARIDLQDVMVIRIDGSAQQSATDLIRTCVELGHALGNQHWPAVVKDSAVYVPLTVDRKVMASVMKTHAFFGVSYDFQPGAEVIPYLAPHEARRLFGGADSTPHSHLPAASDPHTHLDDEGRPLTHSHGTE